MDSLFIEGDNKIVGLVYPDYGAAAACDVNNTGLREAMEENLKTLNNEVAPFERLASIELYPNEFEKTPKRSIKRYLYTNFGK